MTIVSRQLIVGSSNLCEKDNGAFQTLINIYEHNADSGSISKQWYTGAYKEQMLPIVASLEDQSQNNATLSELMGSVPQASPMTCYNWVAESHSYWNKSWESVGHVRKAFSSRDAVEIV